MTVTLSPLERRVGRQLTAAEQHIDVLAIDELLNGAKDQLEQAILDEQRRYARAKARGRAARMEVTDAMRRVISNLREAGRTHGAQELRSMGYPVAPPTRRYAAGDDLEATLRARLATLTVKIEHQALGADISTVAATAVERAAMRILGGRGIAADLVSPAFIGGLAQTFEQHADIVERWQYTAVNDAGLCSLCAPHDGAIYDTLEALFAVLPDFGPNPECLGGSRCRCRAVPVPPDGDTAQTRAPSGGANFGSSQAFAVQEARRILDELGDVHDIPTDAPIVNVRSGPDLPDEVSGEYTRVRGGGPLIKLNPAADTPAFTFLHEYGHYLDDAVAGDTVDFASHVGVDLAEWRDAIGRTAAVQTLLAMAYGDIQAIEVQAAGGVYLLPVDVDFVTGYLLHPSELFARSYSQWAATRLGRPDLLGELAQQQRRAYPEQWDDHDFAPVAEAFDRLIERLGWKTR